MHLIRERLSIQSSLFAFIIFIAFTPSSLCQSLIQAGPMVGYSSSREVGLWIQTKEAASVQYCYHIVGDENTEKCTDQFVTLEKDHFIVKAVLRDLPAGEHFIYNVYLNGNKENIEYPTGFQTLPVWKWRGDVPNFTFAAGSCNYVADAPFDRPGKPYGDEYQIFSQIAKEDPDFMMWLGDNTYLREADWDSESGIYYRYKHTRALPELQPLLGNTHHYAIWDDHDYGPNDSERSYYLKEVTKKVFNDFWFNPVSGVGDSKGITGFFSWLDCDFFLLDNRWYRTPETAKDKSILGVTQVDWLINALSQSHASFKFVCIGGQFISDAAIFENHANFEEEKKVILDEINRLGIKNVIFLTGDRHHSEISKLSTSSGITVHDITSSPLTAGAYDHSEEPNHNRIEGSMVGQRNYALLNVSGPLDERKVQVKLKDNSGKELFVYEISKE